MAGRAYTLTNLADAVHELGDKERATALYEEALALQRELGNERGAARALARLTGSLQVVKRGLMTPTSHSLRSFAFQPPGISLGQEGAQL